MGTVTNGANHYDPDFTAEISTKMRVPEKISVIPGKFYLIFFVHYSFEFKNI